VVKVEVEFEAVTRVVDVPVIVLVTIFKEIVGTLIVDGFVRKLSAS
jgi:hypothetical protein